MSVRPASSRARRSRSAAAARTRGFRVLRERDVGHANHLRRPLSARATAPSRRAAGRCRSARSAGARLTRRPRRDARGTARRAAPRRSPACGRSGRRGPAAGRAARRGRRAAAAGPSSIFHGDRSVAVRRRIDDDPVVAVPAATLAPDDRPDVVDEPADRPILQPRRPRRSVAPRRRRAWRRRRARPARRHGRRAASRRRCRRTATGAPAGARATRPARARPRRASPRSPRAPGTRRPARPRPAGTRGVSPDVSIVQGVLWRPWPRRRRPSAGPRGASRPPGAGGASRRSAPAGRRRRRRSAPGAGRRRSRSARGRPRGHGGTSDRRREQDGGALDRARGPERVVSCPSGPRQQRRSRPVGRHVGVSRVPFAQRSRRPAVLQLQVEETERAGRGRVGSTPRRRCRRPRPPSGRSQPPAHPRTAGPSAQPSTGTEDGPAGSSGQASAVTSQLQPRPSGRRCSPARASDAPRTSPPAFQSTSWRRSCALGRSVRRCRQARRSCGPSPSGSSRIGPIRAPATSRG